VICIAFSGQAWGYSPPDATNDLTETALLTVTGTITANDGSVLEGATIFVKETAKGTFSDENGKYEIEASEGNVLVFKYLGYRTQEVVVGTNATINVTLQEGYGDLEEGFAVGYGTRKKSHNTGAIAQVDGGAVAHIQANRVRDAWAGQLARVLIQNHAGAPAADPTLQVRAASTPSEDSHPLLVVDGDSISGSWATVNADDIESIEVLKDAASAAIYG